jgi:ABC-type Zn uptake system ZnuABC Zn-binding protein ZnuA
MGILSIRKTMILILAMMMVFSIGVAWAGGAAEAESDDDHHEAETEDHHDHEEAHHDDHDHDAHNDDDHHDHGEEHHHEGDMSLPHIEPADLGDGESLRVVASTSIVGDVVGQVAGSAATVDVLMRRGQNPHAYEPTPREMARVEDSYLAFVNGLDLEESLMESIEDVAGSYVVPVSAGITVLGDGGEHDHDHGDDHDDDGHDHDHAGGDPHFWFDPTNVIIWAENIAEALSEADPSNRSIYESNRDAYIAELEALDLEIRQQVSSIARGRRKLVVDHVALTYFADEYGFEVIGEVIPSVSDQAEPSARHVARLTEAMEEEDASAIFIGGTAGRGLRNLVNSVGEEVGREIQIVELLTGSLAPEGSRGDSYLEFVRFNTERIVSALTR